MLTDLRESFKGDVPVLVDIEGNCWVKMDAIRTYAGQMESPSLLFNSKSFIKFIEFLNVEVEREKADYNYSKQFNKYKVKKGKNVMSYKTFMVLCAWLYACKGCSHLTPSDKLFTSYVTAYLDHVNCLSNKSKKESLIVNRLALELKGQTEVPCFAGRIDVATSEEVIEVKDSRKWKEGLGQVLAYNVFRSGRARLHLFGDLNAFQKQIIEKVCSAYAVKVTYEL